MISKKVLNSPSKAQTITIFLTVEAQTQAKQNDNPTPPTLQKLTPSQTEDTARALRMASTSVCVAKPRIAQFKVIEQQVDKKLLFAHLQQHLAPDKGNCARTSCTNSIFGQASAKVRIYFRLRGEKLSIVCTFAPISYKVRRPVFTWSRSSLVTH